MEGALINNTPSHSSRLLIKQKSVQLTEASLE
jgi:hypothetical protein